MSRFTKRAAAAFPGRALQAGLLMTGLAACDARPKVESIANPPADAWERSGSSVLRAGTRGADGLFDTAIADPDVVYDRAAGELHLYYQTGRARVYTEKNPQMGIRHAVSADAGVSWKVGEAFALSLPSDRKAWDSRRTETPSVLFDPAAAPDRRFKLYYSGASGEHPLGFPRYSIGLAISSDGVQFRRLPKAESPYGEDGAVLRVKEALSGVKGLRDGVVADPEVQRIGDLYHLWFSSFASDSQNKLLAFGISHAVSTDGINWKPSADNPIPSLRDASNSGGQQPSVAWNPEIKLWEMWFTSDKDQEKAMIPSTFNPAFGLWRATSPDGSVWTIDYERQRDFYWRPALADEAHGLLTGADAVVIGRNRYVFYTGWGKVGVPDSFIVPTRGRGGYVPSVLNLLRATRPAADR